jgi:hypothetical protein
MYKTTLNTVVETTVNTLCTIQANDYKLLNLKSFSFSFVDKFDDNA